MSFIVILDHANTVVGPFETEDEAQNWANEQWEGGYDVTVLLLPKYANFLQRFKEVNE